MRIDVDERIRADPEELRGLVVAGFDKIDPEGVQVRVELAGRASRSFAGRAYPAPPRRPAPPPGVRFVVRLFLPTLLRTRGYPKTYRYRRLRTAPAITVRDWREALVALAAHEACHVRQFRDGLRRSEVAAERWSMSVLASWTAGAHGSVRLPVPAMPARVEQLAFELGGTSSAAPVAPSISS